MKKIMVSVLFFRVFTAFPLNAANVSFLIMETGLPAGNQSSQYSALWESGLFEIFFEHGHIVSNAPIMRVYEKPEEAFPSDAERDYEDAKRGGMDFFIIAIINYPVSGSRTIPKPQNVILRLFNTKTERMIHEQIFSDTKSKSSREEYDFVKKSVAEFAASLRRQ